MVLKELKRSEQDVLSMVGEVRLEAMMQMVRFPGASAHRQKPDHHRIEKDEAVHKNE